MKEHLVKTVVLSSLYKLFPEIEPKVGKTMSLSGLKNEPVSFQLAYRLFSENAGSMSFFV